MSNFIVLDRAGRQVSIDPNPKNKCGYEKSPDGNFYKSLTDPRCITLKEKRAEIKALKEQEKIVKENAITAKADFKGPTTTTRYQCANSSTQAELEKCISKVRTTWYKDKVIFEDCEIRIQIPTLLMAARGSKWHKVELDKFKGEVSFWKPNNRSDIPDMVLQKAI